MKELETHTSDGIWASRLIVLANRISEGFLAAKTSAEAQETLETAECCAFVKSSDGEVLMANSVYERTFSGRITVGRKAESFLEERIATVARHSDQLVLCGSETTLFSHHGQDAQGREIHMHTVKKSLLGSNQPRAAILGLSALQPATNQTSTRLFKLSQYWEIFKALPERDREIAIALCKGERSRSLSNLHGVTEKTIDNRRTSVLSELQLDNVMELARLLTRLQDNGYCDFGL
ncbi:MAG: hypothetical protein Aurels2KO_36620 [Aureliella sp.]